MGVKRLIAFFSLGFLLSLAACGSSEMTPEEYKKYQEFWAGSSLRFVTGQGNGTTPASQIVSDKPVTQVMLRGTAKVPGYVGGAIVLEVREAEACADGYCPATGKAPLASTVLNAPGFFSLVVPSQGQKVSLTASAPGKSGLLYLGELNSAVDGIELTLQ